MSMSTIENKINKLAASCGIADKQGIVTTNMPMIELFQVTENTPRSPGFYKPGVVIIGNGKKTVYFKSKKFQYDSSQCLVVVAPIVVECESVASRQDPINEIFINLKPEMLYEISNSIDLNSLKQTTPFVVTSITLNTDLKAIILRLLDCLMSKKDSLVLGDAIVREFLYRILTHDSGHSLIEFMLRSNKHASIMKAVNYINTHYQSQLQNSWLADYVAMSVSAFYKAFKEVISISPNQYIKSVRLNKARLLIFNSSTSIKDIAYQAGYSTVSHFYHDYKNFFGYPPSRKT